MGINHLGMSKQDCYWGALAGFLIGLLFLPVVQAARPGILNFNLSILAIIFFIIIVPLGLFISSFISRKIPVFWQVAKFVVTGALNFLVDLGVLSLLIFAFRNWFSVDSEGIILDLGIIIFTFYSIFKATSFIVANINSYFWNKYWTFEENSAKGAGKEFLQFFVVSLIGFFINVLVASYVFKSINPTGWSSDQWSLVGAATGSIAGLIWNFLGYKFIVFKK